MTASSLGFVFGVFVIFGWALLFGGRLPKAFRGRACQGRRWREAFPSATKQEIRDFLVLFVSAFTFDEDEKLKLAPEDEILRLYRAQYPICMKADAMELETLALELERQYGAKLELFWNDGLTLGEVFAETRKPRGSAA